MSSTVIHSSAPVSVSSGISGRTLTTTLTGIELATVDVVTLIDSFDIILSNGCYKSLEYVEYTKQLINSLFRVYIWKVKSGQYSEFRLYRE